MPHSHARRLAWIRAARAAGRRWRSYAALVVVVAVAGTVAAAVPALALREGYAGIVLAGLGVLIALSVIGLTNPAQDGRLAEQWSLHGLRRVRGWHITDTLPFEREDVDHVVVAPSTVLAVESKYRGSTAGPDRHARELAAADRAAQKIRLLMRAERFRTSATVEAVLVVWGPGAPELPTGHRLENGVHVVDGDRPERWSHVFGAPRLSAGERRTLHSGFQRFVAKRAKHDRKNLPSLRAELWREFRGGIAFERAHRAALRRRGSQLGHSPVPAATPTTNPGDAPRALIA